MLAIPVRANAHNPVSNTVHLFSALECSSLLGLYCSVKRQRIISQVLTGLQLRFSLG